MASRYTIHNQQELIPREEEKYNNDIRIYTKFSVNLPTSLLFTVTQAHLTDKINDSLDMEEGKGCDFLNTKYYFSIFTNQVSVS